MYNNHIELLKTIREHTLNYKESRYEMGITTDALRAFLNCRQKDKEGLPEYTKGCKTSREILHSHLGGAIILKKCIEALPNYDKTDNDMTEKQIKTAYK